MGFSLLPITFSEWGQLYSQTTEIVIPFIDNQAPPMTLICMPVLTFENPNCISSRFIPCHLN
ncbi:hypothetical protein XBJ2_1050002 [Xenorhabdus bovienii str. Jollieti]|uniref:Uncharacterized protein n=1 Tax=Xenorhabdus bovienii (strain SS-2004) TaxID=406818 RepID=D3V301_XENBS|nr:hypothetical protein XBJ1_1990 [Xenorhabdus bovienii SS-2004]CDH26963.1 hypothetical protein XBJ2_1050002 [Xenorhabdus bovienii str. Jollieti]